MAPLLANTRKLCSAFILLLSKDLFDRLYFQFANFLINPLFKKMNSTNLPKGVVLLPIENVTVFFAPIEQMIRRSPILSARKYDDSCFYISVPKETCTILHLANYLAMKLGITEIERGGFYNIFPLAIYEKRGPAEYSPLLKRKTMKELQLEYPNCYDAEEDCLNLFYSHNIRIEEA